MACAAAGGCNKRAGIGRVFCYAYGWADYWVCALYVGAGQGIACYGIGMPLMYAVKRYGGKALNGRG